MSVTEEIIKATEKRFGQIPLERRREIGAEMDRISKATKDILNDLIIK